MSIASPSPSQNSGPGGASYQAKPIVTFGGEGTGPGQFQDARHITIDGGGNVYVSDDGTRRVQKFDENGKYLGEWSIEAKGKEAKNTDLQALAADRTGNVYVVWTGLILKYDGTTGKLLDTFAGERVHEITGQTEDFTSIAVWPDGGLWAMSDLLWDDSLVRLDSSGKVINRVEKAVSNVQDVTGIPPDNLAISTDGLGSIYVLDNHPLTPGVFKFTPDSRYVKRFDIEGAAHSTFYLRFPATIAVDNRSRVYFADDDGIRIFDASGRYLDMIKKEAYNYKPFGMAINAKNEIYVVGDKSLVFKFPPFPN